MSEHKVLVPLHHQNNKNSLYSRDICLFLHYLLLHHYELGNMFAPVWYNLHFQKNFPDNVLQFLLYQFLNYHLHLQNQPYSILLLRIQNIAPDIQNMLEDSLIPNLRKDSPRSFPYRKHFHFHLSSYLWQIPDVLSLATYLDHLPDWKNSSDYHFHLYII